MFKLFAPIIARTKGGHKYLALQFIIRDLKDHWRNSNDRPTIPELWVEVEACRPSEADLQDLLLTRKGPVPLKEPDNKKLAAWHILWFLLPFVRQEKANNLADLVTLMEKCIPTQDDLRAVIRWWIKRYGGQDEG